MSHGNSPKAVFYALGANLGIALIKSAAAFITGSGAMLAESIHSFADCGNQGLLLLGFSRSKRPPDDDFPLGYGKAIFFWSFIVALLLFSMGGLFSIYEGVHKLSAPEELTSPVIAVGVLIFSMVLEGLSLAGCLKEVKQLRGGKNLWQWLKESRRSDLVVVFGEDVAALCGLLLALSAVLLTILTGNPVYDAAGSIGIGTLLVIVSLFIAVKIKGLLIGRSADADTEEKIMEYLRNTPEVESVMHIITIQLGEKVMLAVKAKMINSGSEEKMINNINACESGLKKEIPQIQWIFFEPDIKD